MNAQALGVIAVVDSRSVLAWPNADALPHTIVPAALFEYVGERLLMVSISWSVGECDALFTTMNGCLRKRVAKTLTHKYGVLNDGTLFPNPVASELDSICRTDSFVRYMGCTADEWTEHVPIQCVPPPLSVKYHPDCSGLKATMGGGEGVGGGLLLFSVRRPAGRPAGVDLVLLCVCMPHSPT